MLGQTAGASPRKSAVQVRKKGLFPEKDGETVLFPEKQRKILCGMYNCLRKIPKYEIIFCEIQDIIF